jgi:FtsH-binding integral membrane protein
MSATTATAAFLIYAGLTGVTLSTLFLAYTQASIASTFFITAATFGMTSVYGATTKSDLTKIGNLCFMALIGLILASLVNIFMHNSLIYWVTTYAGILIFVGLTAYDTQRIKSLYLPSEEGTDLETGTAITGALALYLDFINLFIMMLRLTGRRR